jgi:hypothetical protein
MIICRFEAMQQLKASLLRHDLQGNLDELNVHPEHRWDQSVLPPSTHLREVTDSPWFKDKVSKVKNQNIFLSDLPDPQEQEPQHSRFLIPVEQRQDATGNDDEEW